MSKQSLRYFFYTFTISSGITHTKQIYLFFILIHFHYCISNVTLFLSLNLKICILNVLIKITLKS